ncbi:MAG: AAA family ATPase [Clostridiales Family XIII bacterium]|jgi:hypothetical protein|nr:AAA family ATPase [Clostridiales Family XIII bacterium]
MTTKITRLEIENVKRVKAVALEPAASGLTVVGGRNGQGKTSVLDAIAWALGGEKYRPSEPRRDGSVLPPRLHVELSNGLVATRDGKNSSLKVLDPSGTRGGQQLLDAFVEKLALDLPRFLEASPKDKAKALLETIGVGDRLADLDDKEQRLYTRRREIGQIADQKRKAAAEMPEYPDAPDEPVAASELIQRQQSILAKNGENQRLRANAAQLQDEVDALAARLEALKKEHADALGRLATAKKSAAELEDEATDAIESELASIDETNRKVRANMDKAHVEADAAEHTAQYEALTADIEATRQERTALLDGAALPLPGLSVQDGELTYGGYKWDNLSGSDQLKVAVSVVRKLNPECGFVLIDKLEQMDPQTLAEFGAWLEGEDLQVIATRVSTGDECSIIIEDGLAEGETAPAPEETKQEEGKKETYEWN